MQVARLLLRGLRLTLVLVPLGPQLRRLLPLALRLALEVVLGLLPRLLGYGLRLLRLGQLLFDGDLLRIGGVQRLDVLLGRVVQLAEQILVGVAELLAQLGEQFLQLVHLSPRCAGSVAAVSAMIRAGSVWHHSLAQGPRAESAKYHGSGLRVNRTRWP